MRRTVLRGEVHHLPPRTALTVDGGAGHVLGHPRHQPDGAGDVAVLATDGVVNRLSVLNMLTVTVQLSVADLQLDEWGRTPASDESPAGLEGQMVPPK